MEMTIHRNYWKGMLAGLIATVALSELMVIKASMGLLPQLDVIQMLGNMFGGGSRSVGWLMHFIIGTVVWGLLFTALFGNGPNGFRWRGIVFSIGAWLMMVIILLPMAGTGFFGLNLGMMAPVMTLLLPVIYGAVLGAAYSALLRHQRHPIAAHH